MYNYFLSADFPRRAKSYQESIHNGRPVTVVGGRGPGISVIPLPHNHNIGKQDLYQWKLGGFTQCSQTCAGGKLSTTTITEVKLYLSKNYT